MIKEFLETYFWQPYVQSAGYNYVNTLTYGVVLILFLILINKAFKRFKVEITYRMVISVVPFIFLGSTIRVIEDAGILPKMFLLVTPGIYLVTFAVTVAALIFSRKTSDPDKTMFVTGLILWLVVMTQFQLTNVKGFAYVLGLFSIVVGVMFITRKVTGLLKDNFDFACLAGHFLDATATFVTIDIFSHLNYWEQHPLTRLIGSLGGSYAWFYVAKLYVLVVLYFINKDVEDKNFKHILKFAVLVLGLAPGLRDALRLSMGV